MGKRTSIYQVFVRDYSKDGTLKALESDLKRIKDMGFEFVYLMPIHSIGKEGRKGSLGSPYSIKDYYDINPDLGTLDDFKSLLAKAHKLNLKIMMDMVLNHTANDSVWVNKHPEYFLKDRKGKLSRKVADWSDVTDLDYNNKNCFEAVLKMLLYWVKLGVDGFRCDVANPVPFSFWKKADELIKKINPNFYWLAESTNINLVSSLNALGYKPSSDGDLASVFDCLYPYSFEDIYKSALKGKGLDKFAYMLNFIYTEFPSKVSELMYLENHDQDRIFNILKGDRQKLENWLAFSFCYDGTAFVYAGQEANAKRHPSLFEKESIGLENIDTNCVLQITHLNKLRKEILNDCLDCNMAIDKNELVLTLTHKKYKYLGIFDVLLKGKEIKVNIKNGEYTNMLDNSIVIVKDGFIKVNKKPLLIKYDS